MDFQQEPPELLALKTPKPLKRRATDPPTSWIKKPASSGSANVGGSVAPLKRFWRFEGKEFCGSCWSPWATRLSARALSLKRPVIPRIPVTMALDQSSFHLSRENDDDPDILFPPTRQKSYVSC